jgi:hypothetical protein
MMAGTAWAKTPEGRPCEKYNANKTAKLAKGKMISPVQATAKTTVNKKTYGSITHTYKARPSSGQAFKNTYNGHNKFTKLSYINTSLSLKSPKRRTTFSKLSIIASWEINDARTTSSTYSHLQTS